MRCAILAATCAVLLAQQPNAPKPPHKLAGEERERIQARLRELRAAISALRIEPALRADVEVYAKAAEYMLRFEEEFYTPAYVNHTLRVLDIGLERARTPGAWTAQKGRLCRAYVSRVDGSVQPYCLVIPPEYDPARLIRLDVVLHGRAATMTEASFLASHHSEKPVEPDVKHIRLEVFGRTNNAYRWSGETDVFEALASVRARYNIDPERIVLRGFSMGGAGTWHIGLHHPCEWAAIEAGAGFNETRQYAKLAGIPAWQEKTLHIYDAFEYAANAFNVPAVGYGGEIDPQLQASRNIQDQLQREAASVRALFLVGPGTAHKWHPDSQKESDAFIGAALPRPDRDRIHFVTYTTRYNRCDWLTIDGLERHYERAEVDARRSGGQVSISTRNVSRLSLSDSLPVVIDGTPVRGKSFLKTASGWRAAGGGNGLRKRHSLQGPIDDAFMDSFLCVRPEGGDARLDRFAAEWAKWLRGDIRIKSAHQVTAADIREHNLILFGDAASNRLIARVASRLPALNVQADELLAMIYPNPLNPAKYVVLNSGHTFGEREFRGTNALLFPRLGDWAIVRKSDGAVVRSGFFDESWR